MVYEPDEDSFLLEEQVKKYAFGKVLDVGTGSGIQALAALQKAKSVMAVDIDDSYFNELKKKGIKTLKSDLFKNVKGKFDTIIFNPPYLPEHKYDKQKDTSGGKEIIEKFLKQAKKHLNKNGIILLIFSTLTGDVINLFKKYGYKYKKLSEKKIFFETLYVYALRRH